MDFKNLNRWFSDNKRSFPWREAPSPYQVWVSEVMLQQTRASVVIDYFNRWMENFPSIERLAGASVEEIIKSWEGLGYYSRARNLHKGANYIIENYDGLLPSNREDLEKIPGLGPYTAGAILSFAFKKRAAALDGNVIRVLARQMQYEEDISKPKSIKELRSILEEALPQENAHVSMEALIEIGATVCGKQPQCHICPIQMSCKGYLSQSALQYPKKKKRIPPTILHRHVMCYLCQNQILVKKEESSNLMGDLWQFPYFDYQLPIDHQTSCVNVKPVYIHELSQVVETFTRYKAYLYPKIIEMKTKFLIEGFRWIKVPEIAQLPFSSGHRKILKEVLYGDHSLTSIRHTLC